MFVCGAYLHVDMFLEWKKNLPIKTQPFYASTSVRIHGSLLFIYFYQVNYILWNLHIIYNLKSYSLNYSRPWLQYTQECYFTPFVSKTSDANFSCHDDIALPGTWVLGHVLSPRLPFNVCSLALHIPHGPEPWLMLMLNDLSLFRQAFNKELLGKHVSYQTCWVLWECISDRNPESPKEWTRLWQGTACAIIQHYFYSCLYSGNLRAWTKAHMR